MDDEFEPFLRRYQDMVYTTAVRLLGDAAEAEDVAQEAFLKAYERFDELKASPAAGGWLKTVATNLCLNHLSRYRGRFRFFGAMAGEGDEEAAWPEFPGEGGADQVLDVKDRQERLETALQGLPEAQRVPLVLFHFDELSYEDIAEKLGVSLAKVKTDIFRGRQALMKTLGEGA